MRAALLVALLATGCATVDRAPPAARADAALPPAFALLDADAPASGTLAGLMPTGDPAFAALERAALSGAPTLDAALARLEAARGRLRGAAAARRPELDFSASAEGERFNPQQFGAPGGAAIDPERKLYQLGIGASWDVDLFGRLRAEARAAAARLDAATADASAVRLALRADIARSVIDLRRIEARLAVASDDLAHAEELAALTRKRVAAGIDLDVDRVRAEALAADAASRIEPLLAERAAQTGALVTLTAIPAQQVLAAFGTPLPEIATAPPPPLAVPSRLLRRRPDVAAAERRLAAADADIAAAAAARYPSLSISGDLGLFSLGLGSLFNEDALIGSVAASLAGPLIDFGRVGARIAERQADARAAFADYRDSLFTALGETETALGALAAADRRVARIATQVALNADAVELARARWMRGLDSFLAVIDAERSAFTSRAALVDARAEAARRRVALYAAVGGEPGA